MCRGKERGRVRQEQDRTGWLGSKADDHSGSKRDGKAGHTVAKRPQVLPVRVGQKSRAAAGQQPRRAGGVHRAAVTDWAWDARGTHAQRPRGTPRNDTTQETAFRPPLTSGKSWRAGCKPLPPTKDRAGTVRQCTQTISRPARPRDRLLCYSYTVRVRRAPAVAAAGGCRSGPDKNTAACDEAAGAANRLPLLLWPGSSAKASAPPQTPHSPSRRGVSNSAMRIGVGVGGGGWWAWCADRHRRHHRDRRHHEGPDQRPPRRRRLRRPPPPRHGDAPVANDPLLPPLPAVSSQWRHPQRARRQGLAGARTPQDHHASVVRGGG